MIYVRLRSVFIAGEISGILRVSASCCAFAQVGCVSWLHILSDGDGMLGTGLRVLRVGRM